MHVFISQPPALQIRDSLVSSLTLLSHRACKASLSIPVRGHAQTCPIHCSISRHGNSCTPLHGTRNKRQGGQFGSARSGKFDHVRPEAKSNIRTEGSSGTFPVTVTEENTAYVRRRNAQYSTLPRTWVVIDTLDVGHKVLGGIELAHVDEGLRGRKVADVSSPIVNGDSAWGTQPAEPEGKSASSWKPNRRKVQMYLVACTIALQYITLDCITASITMYTRQYCTA